MASLIMAVTVLPWVVLTVPGWAAVQAMADPVHTTAVPVAVAATVAPVPTAVRVAAVLVVAAQAMADPVLTVVVLVAAAMVVDPAAPTAVPVAAMAVALAVQAAVLAVARAMAVMAGQGPDQPNQSFLPRGPLARPFCFSASTAYPRQVRSSARGCRVRTCLGLY